MKIRIILGASILLFGSIANASITVPSSFFKIGAGDGGVGPEVSYTDTDVISPFSATRNVSSPNGSELRQLMIIC